MGKYYDDIIKTKPGLTGYWQVSGRSDVSFKKRLKFEISLLSERFVSGIVYSVVPLILRISAFDNAALAMTAKSNAVL